MPKFTLIGLYLGFFAQKNLKIFELYYPRWATPLFDLSEIYVVYAGFPSVYVFQIWGFYN